MKPKTPPHLKRPRPAYLSFAADWIANEAYVGATASERGVLFSLLNYCWVNGTAPVDPDLLSKLLGLSRDEVAGAIASRLVAGNFYRLPSDPSRFTCTELTRQREENEEARRQMSEGGRKGGIRTQSNLRSLQSRHPSSLAQAPEKSRDEKIREALSKEVLTRQVKTDDLVLSTNSQEWSSDYSREEQAQAYRRASNGG